MDMVKLTVSARDANASPKGLRKSGQVPCIVYGNDMQSTSLQIEERALHKAFVQAGESTLVELDMGGKKVPVLFKEIDFDPVSGRERHVDFYAVNMKEEIETEVPIHIEGESPAVKELQAIIVTPQDHVTVQCLPSDLPHALTIDISSLAQFHESLTVAAIKVPKGVTIIDPPETVLVTVQEPRKEEVIEVQPTPEEAAAAAAATAEGAAPAEGATPAGEGDSKAEDKK